MNPDRWQKIESIFQAAIDLEIEDRKKFLEKECQEDLDLKAEVEQLLADSDSAESFIEKPVWTDSFFVDSSAKENISDSLEELYEDAFADESLIGKRIGVFELREELGRGGMGAVYLAERADGEFRQKVAVKLIKRGMDSDFIIRRFRHERQILANFEHPYIARLLDGGTTAEGLPYFMMEYIEGKSLYEFCDKKRLNIRERLEIFRQICSAIAYAHERQIIHRDIKPSNILFTKSGMPKLLDFGIAKILDSDLIHESVSPTASIVRLMTPDYASPEQVEGKEITPASDIYSLGVLLYELLTGHRPYNFAGKSLHEISRNVCEVVPKLPSEIVGTNENFLPKYAGNENQIAETRQTTSENLKKDLNGNLDKIIMKSLAKNSAERYSTVEEFSEDIGRFLKGEQIRASSFLPKKNGFTNENLLPTEGKSLAVLPFKTLNLSSTEDTGDKFLGLGLADALITRLSKIREFIVRPTSSILGFEDENFDVLKAARELQVKYILDGNIKRLGERLRVTVQLLDVDKNATVWATSIDETIGDFFSLEDKISNKVVEALLPQITGSDLIEFSKRGTDNAEAFEYYLRGRYYFNTSTEEGFAKAFVSFHNAIAEDENFAHAYVGLADYYTWLGIFSVLPPQECFQSAIKMAKKAVELDENLAEAHASLGFSIHAGNYDWSKAEYHLSRALELNPNYATAMTWFSIVRLTEGRFDEGLEFARRSIQLDPLTPFNHHNLGWGFYFARRYDESIAQYRQVVADFPNYGLGYYGLSKVLRLVGETEEALEQLEKSKKMFGESIFIKLATGQTLAAKNDTKKTQELLRELHKLSAERFVSHYHLALIYAFSKETEKVFAELEKAFETKDSWLNWLGVEPVFDFLRDDERFQKFLERTGYDVFFGLSSIGNRSFMESVGTKVLQNSPTLFIENADSDANLTAETLQLKPQRFWQKAKFYYITFGIVAILFGLYATEILEIEVSKGDKRLNAASVLNNQNSIVILPFQTANSAEENLGIGLADALTNRLGYIKRLSVIAPNSARSVKNDSIPDIGKMLNVGFVIRGNLEKQDQQINVQAEMINSADESIVWTENFTAKDGNLFEVQTKIAEKIWTALNIEPLSNEKQIVSKVFTNNPTAYNSYLIGRYQMSNRSPENIRKAINSFSQAVKADKNFALAYAGLSDAYILQKIYEMPPPKDVFENAKKNALKAIELDENLVEAHTSLAYFKFHSEREYETAELEFRRAIQLNPSYSQAHHWFSILLLATKRPAESIAEIKTAVELDPNSNIVHSAWALSYFYNKNYDEAINICQEVLKKNNDFVPAYRILRSTYIAKNDYKSARSALENEMNYSGGEMDDAGWYMIIAQVESLGKNKKEVIEKLDKAVEQPIITNSLATFSNEIAIAYNLLGEKEKALDWLEKGELAGDSGFIFMEVDPRFENLRSEPRFQKLAEKWKN